MNSYLLFKSLHLIAVISWMAGLLYLPRIFVYHVENYKEEKIRKVFETMERKLYNYIMRPAMVASWIFGIILIHLNGLEALTYLWMQLKLVLVILLSVYHEYLGRCLNALKLGHNNRSSKFFRIINEVPTVILIIIIFIVIFKPI